MLLDRTLYGLTTIMSALAAPFWITADVLAIEWKDGCLKAVGCMDSWFKLSEWDLISSERVTASWPVSQNTDSMASFVSYWKRGKPSDVIFRCDVVGVDPIYGFSRNCDFTRSIRIFDELYKESNKKDFITESTSSSLSVGRLIVELKGKCFNSTLGVQKHEQFCPWCSNPNEFAVIRQRSEVEPQKSFLFQVISQENLVNASVITLAVITTITSAAFSCLLIAYIRQRRVNLSSLTKKSCEHQSIFQNSQTGNNSLLRSTDSKYETPWDCCESHTQYWMNSNYHSRIALPNPKSTSISHPESTMKNYLPQKGASNESKLDDLYDNIVQ